MGSSAGRCGACQALIPRDAARCDVCGAAVSAPRRGARRLLFGALLAAVAVAWHQLPAPRTARSYYEEGLECKRRGWVEASRRALSMAVEMDKGEVGHLAALYMRAYLPAHPVTREAQDLNIRGYNLQFGGRPEEARRAYRECIQRYPDFEWPYGNLGALMVSQGEVQEGIEVLEKALAINPSYRNGLLHMAHAHLARGDRAAACAYFRRALAADPMDRAVRQEARENGCPE